MPTTATVNRVGGTKVLHIIEEVHSNYKRYSHNLEIIGEALIIAVLVQNWTI